MPPNVITLAYCPGTPAAMKSVPFRSPAKKQILASETERKLAFASIDFFIKRCQLGANLLSRKLKWKNDVKSVLRLHATVTQIQIQELAQVIGLTVEEFLACGTQPPVERIDEFILQFKTTSLVELKNKHSPG